MTGSVKRGHANLAEVLYRGPAWVAVPGRQASVTSAASAGATAARPRLGTMTDRPRRTLLELERN